VSNGISANGHALAMAGQFMIFCWNVSPVNEQKVEISILLLNRVFSAETAAQQRTKADEMHVTPSYCQCDVSGCTFSSW
jgi:hypothetical protein